MRKTIITLFAVIALIGTTTASAHLMVTKHCATLSCINGRQLQNLKHARYVCRHGANQNKRWNCAAVSWLKREYNQTEAVLHPRVSVSSHYSMWICIHNKEGAWNSNTGNGYYGGLQMTSGWGGVSRPDQLSPAAQIALAEGQYAASGYSLSWLRGQWPNTSYGCI